MAVGAHTAQRKLYPCNQCNPCYDARRRCRRPRRQSMALVIRNRTRARTSAAWSTRKTSPGKPTAQEKLYPCNQCNACCRARRRRSRLGRHSLALVVGKPTRARTNAEPQNQLSYYTTSYSVAWTCQTSSNLKRPLLCRLVKQTPNPLARLRR